MTTNFDSIRSAFEEAYPSIDPSGVYCLFTGKKIGYIFADEWNSLVESIDSDDPEAVADDLAVRLFASMRPSMRWNKLSRESINLHRKANPVETLAYLMNRFRPETSDSQLDVNHNRVKVFNWASQLDETSRSEWLYRLIDVDAKLSLTTMKMPWPVDQLARAEGDIVTTRDSWYRDSLKKFEAEEKRREQQTNWYRTGNTLSKVAHVSQFMESNPSQSSIKTHERRKEQSAMSALLRAVMDETGVEPLAEGLTRPPVSTPKVMTRSTKQFFGGRMPTFNSKKESN